MRGTWVYNTLFGYFTYLPLSGYGYSPYNLVIVSPRTVYQPTYSPGVSGFDMGVSRSAASSPVYSGASSASSGAVIAAPAVSAPAAAAPNTGGGADAGRRR
jgi:hypothetical protein